MTKRIAHTTFCLGRILMLAVLLSSLWAQSQTNEYRQRFKSNLERTLKERPKTYEEIDLAFSPFNKDSVLIKKLRAAAHNADYLEGESYALNVLGVTYRNLSLYNKSIRYHKNAMKLAIEADNLGMWVGSLNNIGVSYRRMDQIKLALDNHFKALELASAIKNPTEIIKYNIAVSQNSLGNIYLALDQNELAIDYFKKSLVLEKEMGNRLGMAINYQNIGHAYENLGSLDLALANYRRSLDYNEQIGSEIGHIICYNSIGQVFIKQEKFEDAEIIIGNALTKALVEDDKFYTSISHNNLGWVYIKTGRYQRAEQNLIAALDMARKYNLKSSEVTASKLLHDLSLERNDYEQALTHYKNSIELGSTINNERNLKYVNDVIIQYENESKNRQIESLSSENIRVKERLKRNKIIFWLALLSLFTATIVLLIVSKNRRLNQDKRILTLEQDMLRNQMNPHFIFNSLNSIKLYIINNEKENAVYYLNKFSKLIRKILVSSSEKIISLKDELDTMQLYMNIENIRFSNQIDFGINIEDDVDTSLIKVPPLILQPFLENALWHGLSTIDYDKRIDLNVKKSSSDFVSISITDNGIGRKKSMQINKEKRLRRKSLGLDITKARLYNFSEGFTDDYKLTIEDLYDKNNKALGTKVVLEIPTRSNVLKTA